MSVFTFSVYQGPLSLSMYLCLFYFEHWFNREESFLIDFGHGFERGDYGKAAFELHQSAEHAYKTILLVFKIILINV